MEKKNQPLILVGYCEDMKAYRILEPITKGVFFRRVVYFDEGFNPTSNTSPSSDCHADNDVEHVDNFSLEDDDDPFEAQHQHQPKENLPPTPTEHDHYEQEKLDQELHLSRRFCDRKRPHKYVYEPTDFSYSASATFPIQLQIIGVSFFSHTISSDPQQFSDVVGIPE